MDWRELFSENLIGAEQGYVNFGKVKRPEWEDGLLTLRVMDISLSLKILTSINHVENTECKTYDSIV
ncbi:MAG: hypothetical protein E7298_01195 [Lachnospiraceae bacterium]|nr:hypothetical protein [Lachnospiraceae bacterium]